MKAKVFGSWCLTESFPTSGLEHGQAQESKGLIDPHTVDMNIYAMRSLRRILSRRKATLAAVGKME